LMNVTEGRWFDGSSKSRSCYRNYMG
jgi:hypothetical protein